MLKLLLAPPGLSGNRLGGKGFEPHLLSLQTPLFSLILSIAAPSLKALIVPGLTDPWDHVQQEPVRKEQSELMQAGKPNPRPLLT